MNRYIILVIAIFISICQQDHGNKCDNNITNTGNVINESSNNESDNLAIKMNVEIWLDSSVKVKKDTLYFEYKIINNTSKNLLFYHIQYLDVKLESFTESDYPKCSIHIINSNKKLPETGIVQLQNYFVVDSNNNIQNLHKKSLLEDKEYSYILLPRGNRKTFVGKTSIGNYQLLGKSFELKLKYLSPYNKVFVNQFKKMQAKNPRLKEYERFEGVIESNCCPFTLY